MGKKLLITSTDLMMLQFLVPHVINLSQQGYQIDLACSNVGGRFDEIGTKVGNAADNIFKLSLQRSPISTNNAKGYRELKNIISSGHYDIIWTNEPVMGVATRLAARKARKRGSKLIYMAHGFHFYSGAPMLNWIIYYPVEKLMAHLTDLLVTVNHEDFKRAKSFKTGKVSYVHGIGINTARLTQQDTRNDIRNELGLQPDSFLVLSVGELNANKNQKTIIKAIHSIANPNIHYLICGKGSEEEALRNVVTRFRLENHVHFLGYRTDVVDICSQSDVYTMPSHREGLPVSSLEAMYCGLPLVASHIRGLVDVIEHGVNGFLCNPDDSESFAKYILQLYQDKSMREKMGHRNRDKVIPYTMESTKAEIETLIAHL